MRPNVHDPVERRSRRRGIRVHHPVETAFTIAWNTQLDFVGLKKATVYQLHRTGQFPHNVKITSPAVGWVEEEVQQWLAERRNRRSGPAPFPWTFFYLRCWVIFVFICLLWGSYNAGRSGAAGVRNAGFFLGDLACP
jgi:predicted DNA-binding transcriptional regulator AlpA